VRLGVDDQLLLFAMHHIVSDAWSMGILIRELVLFYGAAVGEASPPLPPLPIQYPDYALWQRRRLGGEGGEALAPQTAFWVAALAGAERLDLATDLPRPPVLSPRGGAEWRLLPAPLRTGLLRLAESRGATLFMAFAAGLDLLLSRYSGQTDLSLGFVVAGRTRPEMEGLIGFFVNTLVLRADLGGEPGFAEVLDRVRRAALAAYGHQDLPFERVVEAVKPPRDRGRSPLFQVMLAFQDTPRGHADSALDLPGLTLEPLEVESGSVKFDLAVSVKELPQGLSLRAGYRADLFVPTTIRRLLGHLEALLTAALAEPERPFATLPVRAEPERHQLLFGLRDTAAPRPLSPDLPALLGRQAAERPDAVAVAAFGEALTFRQLDQEVSRLAWLLRSPAFGRVSRVGLAAERSPAWLTALLAIRRSGSPSSSPMPGSTCSSSAATCRCSLRSPHDRRASFPWRS
jgi:non-ribosomal peptide synthetase component F